MATWPLRYHDSIGDFYTPGVKGVGVNRAGIWTWHQGMDAQSGLHRAGCTE